VVRKPGSRDGQYAELRISGDIYQAGRSTDELCPVCQQQGAAKFHTFRYFAATMVNQKAGNLKLVQRLLGHSNLNTTADVYTHTSVDANRSAALALEEAIFGDLFQVVPRFGTWNENAAPN